MASENGSSATQQHHAMICIVPHRAAITWRLLEQGPGRCFTASPSRQWQWPKQGLHQGLGRWTCAALGDPVVDEECLFMTTVCCLKCRCCAHARGRVAAWPKPLQTLLRRASRQKRNHVFTSRCKTPQKRCSTAGTSRPEPWPAGLRQGLFPHRCVVVLHQRAVGKAQSAVQAQRRCVADRDVQKRFLHAPLAHRLLQRRLQ